MKRIASLVAVSAALLAAIPFPVAAEAATTTTVLPCGARTLRTPYTRLGDANDYWLLQGGDFEANGDLTYGTTAQYGIWTATNNGFGVSPANGNEPWYATGRTTDSMSLHVSPPSSIQSPIFCAGGHENVFRFNYYTLARAGSSLEVWANIQETGQTYRVASLPSGTSPGWTTSPPLKLWDLGAYTQVHVVLTFKPIGSEIWMDDVFIDPFRSCC